MRSRDLRVAALNAASLLLLLAEPAGSARISRRAALALPAAGLAVSPLAALVREAAADEELAADAVPEESAPAPPTTSAFEFDVPFRGEPRDIKPFLGAATVVVNVKYDDPITLEMLPGLTGMLERYASAGLHVLAFPTDQGWFEAEDSNTLRLMFKNTYDFGQYPRAVVFDKADLLGGNALPLYAWLTAAEPNPWGVSRIVFNYEKFLVDARGQPLRRYPRKFPIALMESDVQAALAGEPLPPPSAKLVKAWEEAKREATKSEYAFKPGLNYYKTGSPAS